MTTCTPREAGEIVRNTPAVDSSPGSWIRVIELACTATPREAAELCERLVGRGLMVRIRRQGGMIDYQLSPRCLRRAADQRAVLAALDEEAQKHGICARQGV